MRWPLWTSAFKEGQGDLLGARLRLNGTTTALLGWPYSAGLQVVTSTWTQVGLEITKLALVVFSTVRTLEASVDTDEYEFGLRYQTVVQQSRLHSVLGGTFNLRDDEG